jgi:hypothetical protein
MINSQADSVYFDSNKDLTHQFVVAFSLNPLQKRRTLFAVPILISPTSRSELFGRTLPHFPPTMASGECHSNRLRRLAGILPLLAAILFFRQNNHCAVFVPLIISDQNLAALLSGKPLVPIGFFRDSAG